MCKYLIMINGKIIKEFDSLSDVSAYLSVVWFPGMLFSVVKTLNGIVIDNYI